MDTPPIASEVLVQVRAEMARQGLTQARLADLLGIPYGTIKARLAGSTSLTIAHLDAIARALGTDASTLMSRAEQAAA